MLSEAEIQERFDAAGFRVTHHNGRTVEFQGRSNGQYVYLNKERLLNSNICLYIHPALPNPNVSGAQKPDIRFRSHLRHFPSRVNNGKTACHYGQLVQVDNSVSLARLLEWLKRL